MCHSLLDVEANETQARNWCLKTGGQRRQWSLRPVNKGRTAVWFYHWGDTWESIAEVSGQTSSVGREFLWGCTVLESQISQQGMNLWEGWRLASNAKWNKLTKTNLHTFSVASEKLVLCFSSIVIENWHRRRRYEIVYSFSPSFYFEGVGLNSTTQSVLSRPMQRKLVTLVHCQLVEEEGRIRAMRAARSLGERTVTELILQHQNPQQLSSNLWAAVRARGCQFLGPGRWCCF